jgi:hypothetical protein
MIRLVVVVSDWGDEFAKQARRVQLVSKLP